MTILIMSPTTVNKKVTLPLAHEFEKSDGLYSLFQFEGSDVIFVLKSSIEYSFVFFKCLFSQKSRMVAYVTSYLQCPLHTTVLPQNLPLVTHATFWFHNR